MHVRQRVRSRGVILHEGTLLVVKNARGSAYYALPGGHVDIGETPAECMVRELKEELGVDALIGRLLYVYTFVDRGGEQSIEFIFEIANGDAFIDHEALHPSHAHELSEVRWITPNDSLRLLPEEIHTDFKEGVFPRTTKFIRGSALDK